MKTLIGLCIALCSVLASAQSVPLSESTRFATAGMRDEVRNIAESKKIYESLPAPLRIFGTTADMKGLDGSHIVPHSRGGSSAADNLVFESASKNRARGARVMTAKEVAAAKVSLWRRGFQAAARSCLANAALGGSVGLAADVVASVLEFGISRYYGVGIPSTAQNALDNVGLSGAALGSAIGCALTATAVLTGYPLLATAATTLIVSGVVVLTAELYGVIVKMLGYDPLAILWGYVKDAMTWLDESIRDWLLPKVQVGLLTDISPVLREDTQNTFQWFLSWALPWVFGDHDDVVEYKRVYKTVEVPMSWSKWWST